MGLAVGDALGATVEFCIPGTFEPVIDLVGGGPFQLPPGGWTDDTSQALAAAAAMVAFRGFDPKAVMERLCQWYRSGRYSVNGKCFDIGMTSASALRQFQQYGGRNPYQGLYNPTGSSNGCLMRLAPVPMAYRRSAYAAAEASYRFALLTHGAPPAVGCTRWLGGVLASLMMGRLTKSSLVDGGFDATQAAGEDVFRDVPVEPFARSIANEVKRFRGLASHIAGVRACFSATGALRAALWAYANGDTFEEVVFLAANLGDDADTVGAIAGQLAGATYGESGIPQRWRDGLAKKDELRLTAIAVAGLAGVVEPLSPLTRPKKRPEHEDEAAEGRSYFRTR